MRAALAALPGVRHVRINFHQKRAVVTVEPAGYDKTKFLDALNKAGFGGVVKSVKSARAVPIEDTEATANPPDAGLSSEVSDA